MSSEAMDTRLQKLPAWARREFANLKSNLIFAQQELQKVEEENARLRAGTFAPEATSTTLRPFMQPPVHLPDDEPIRFELGSRRRYLDIKLARSGDVEVSGSGVLAIRPVASNVIQVSAVER